MTISLSELERRIRQSGTIAVNIQFDGNFRVHVRDNHKAGFTCAQGPHETLGDALREHFKPVELYLLDGL